MPYFVLAGDLVPAGTTLVTPALQAKPKEMLSAELRNNCTAGVATNHSVMFTLLLELNPYM